MGRYFGTDGFRGEANVALTCEHAYKIGVYLGGALCREGKRKEVVIGRDTRLSGDMLESALVAGLTSAGATAVLLGVTTTPAVAYAVKKRKLSCGVMISASHNPYSDNGIKLFGEDGEKMSERTIAGIEDFLDGRTDKPAPAQKNKIGKARRPSDGNAAYKKFLTANGTDLSGLKVGLDCANGSAYLIAKAVFRKLGAAVTVINARPDGLNINAACGSTHTEGLQKLVREKGLDIGFAYDGDADRCIAVDERGEVVNGDKILYVCGRYLKERGRLKNNTVVTTVMSNFGLYKALQKAGINYVKTDVGDKYVREYMLMNGCTLGGEQSGHVIFGDLANAGDGILTSLQIARVILEKGARLSELSNEVKDYPQVLLNVRVTDKNAAINDVRVRESITAAEAELGEGGRILVRKSGTEPLVRIMVEAEEKELCVRLAEKVRAALTEGGYERKD